MSLLQALFMAVLQGVTELFPISSLAHAVIVPPLLGWNVDQAAESFLPFVVALHMGTAIAALLFFWKDWAIMALSLLGDGDPVDIKRERTLLFHVIVATIPAVILALLFEKAIRGMFATPEIAAGFLIVNGGLLFFGERRRRQGGDRLLEDFTWKDALVVGFAQATALFPGISRSGATMVAGLMRGLHHEEAARFSFLIATPIILGAGVHQLPKLLRMADESGDLVQTAMIGGVVAGITAFLAIWGLMKYFKGNDIKALDPFAWYCWFAGASSLLLLSL